MNRLSDIRYRDFYIGSLILVLFGLSLDSITNIWIGLIDIIRSPSVLVTDYMEVGGMGSAFVNSGAMLFLSAFISSKSGARITGALVAGLFAVIGFSFFGKNIINSIPLMMGVYLYTKFKDLRISNYMHIMCFVTGISPIVSLFYYGLAFNPIIGFILGISVGIIIGFIIIPLSSSMLAFHDGYSLYNAGFSLGIIGMVFAGIIRMFDLEIPTINLVYEGVDLYPFIFMLAISLLFVVYGFYRNKGLSGYKKAFLDQSGRLVTDFTLESNKYLVLFNIGILGLISIIFVLISGGKFNGPIIGGIFTVMGFGAFGKHPRNVIPIMLGVFITSILNKYDPSGTPAVLTALFATTLAPIAGDFGLIAGLFAGFIHKAVATNVGFIHGGVNLYNNGLAGALVAAVLVPLYKNFTERFRHD